MCKICEFMQKDYDINKRHEITIDFINEYLNFKYNAKCISEEFISATTYLDVICKNKHLFKINWNKIKDDVWCRQCYLDDLCITVEKIQSFLDIEHSGSKCLIEKYIPRQQISIQCEHGIVFNKTWNLVKLGSWCDCLKKAKPTIESINDFVKEKYEGELLSTEYISTTSDLLFKCKFDHVFESNWHRVYNIHWCPICAKNKKIQLEDFEKLLIENYPGAELLDKNIENSKTEVSIKCKFNHVFISNYYKVKNDGWCPFCKDLKEEKRRLEFFNKVLDLISKNEGIYISGDYVNKESKFLVKCKNLHTFYITYTSLSEGCWCHCYSIRLIDYSKCNNSFGENFTRIVFTNIFKSDFIKIRPNFLKNPKTNRNLELDGYAFIDYLNYAVAFEYQGAQHNEIISIFNMTEIDLIYQKQKDQMKRDKCKENNVKLIEIPQFNKKFKLEDLKDFIGYKCIELEIELPDDFDQIIIDVDQIKREIYSIKAKEALM